MQHTTMPLYNPFSNPVECFHRTIIAMLRTRGEGIQENWDLWINASVFAYNTTVSLSTGVTPHYAMFGREATLPVDWVFPTPSSEKRTLFQWTGEMLEERQHLPKYERGSRGKSTPECTVIQTFDAKHQSRVFSLVFLFKNNPCHES